MNNVMDTLERTYRQAVESFLLRDEMSRGGLFLGLHDAPSNNIEFYASREHFANWLKGQHELLPQTRTRVSAEAIVKRLEEALQVRGYAGCEFFNTLLAVAITESGLRNAGYGRDRKGTSAACGVMQTKWCAVMDGGYRYETYLDIVLDRHPLIGVDAGVGYFMRLFHMSDGSLEERLRKTVCCYNRPGTDPTSNPEYYAAHQRASESDQFLRFSK